MPALEARIVQRVDETDPLRKEEQVEERQNRSGVIGRARR